MHLPAYVQCQLLTDVVDAELEEELQGGCPTSRLSLTQPFPFEGCPPTTAGPCHSPGLQRLTDAVAANLGAMSEAERNSLVKVGRRRPPVAEQCWPPAGHTLLHVDSVCLHPLLSHPPPAPLPAAGAQRHRRLHLLPALDRGAGHRGAAQRPARSRGTAAGAGERLGR